MQTQGACKSWITLLSMCLSATWQMVMTEPVIAQVSPDRTLPQSSRANTRSNQIEITGGTQVGGNLFHSFERFSVPEGRTVFFNNGSAIQSIFSRVTGRTPSQVDGRIRANGNANLFLLNPNGIIFGPNASLDIGGAFVASTANQIRFADGATFSAVDPQASPLLTVSVPVGLQMGRNSAAIQVQGNGHGLFLNARDNPSVNRTDRTVGLAVNPGQTLALVAGDLALVGGNLTASSGRIALGSVTAGEVELQPVGAGWQLGYDAVEQFGDIRLNRAASLEASGERGGVIQIQGQNIRINGTSALLADTLGTGTGGRLSLNATETIRVSGSGLSSRGTPFVSRLSTDVAPGATGPGGNLTITAERLQILNGAQISSGTFGVGDAGSLQLVASTVEISGGSAVGPSGLFVPVEAAATGAGGRLSLEAERLQISNGAQIAVSTFGAGNAGSLTVQADQVELQSGSGLFAIVEAGARGNGGLLTLVADRVQISGGAQVSTSTAGAGNAGSLQVRADQIEVSGATGSFASGLFTSVEPGATGRGGSLTMLTEQLQIQTGGEISATTFSRGAAGDVMIQADQITVSGGTRQSPSAIVAASRGSGNGGTLTIQTRQLRLDEGGQIVTATAGSGNAGSLIIQAAVVALQGRTPQGRSGLFANAIGDGAGGDLTLTTDRLTVQDGATISVSNFSSAGPAQAPGQGDVGSITINAEQITLDRQGILTAESAAGDRGNIALSAETVLLRRRSAITTNSTGAARGGNIAIDTDVLLAAENSDISANAENNFGGRVQVRAEAVLGTQVRSQLTPASDITASSALGAEFSGTVDLDAPVVDPNQGLVALPVNLIDASNQIATACAETAGNSFVITGRGGLPEAPTQLLRGEALWEDLRSFTARSMDEPQPIPPEATRPPEIPLEAQNWIRNEAGQVTLIAQANRQPSLSLPPTDCAARQEPNS